MRREVTWWRVRGIVKQGRRALFTSIARWMGTWKFLQAHMLKCGEHGVMYMVQDILVLLYRDK